MSYKKSLKIKLEDYLYMQRKLKDKLSSIGLTLNEAQQKCLEQGYSEKATRWYLLRGAGLIPFVCETLYQYLDDNHIDSALKAIMKG